MTMPNKRPLWMTTHRRIVSPTNRPKHSGSNAQKIKAYKAAKARNRKRRLLWIKEKKKVKR
ncbi:MAG: hypothetical protein NTW59_00520 [Candidatus Diapherotrites archaeon]|nr:hypothetical protein [Candidatus Diapherotrites archaeon]